MKLRTHIALGLLVAAVAVPVAHAGAPTRSPTVAPAGLDPGIQAAINDHAQTVQGYRLVTDTLGGNGHAQTVQGYRLVTDTLGGNGQSTHNVAPAGLDPGIQAAINAHNVAPAGLDPGIQAAINTHNAASSVDTSTSPTGNGAGFDWADAGIGAGGMLGLMLLAGTAALVMQGRRRLA